MKALGGAVVLVALVALGCAQSGAPAATGPIGAARLSTMACTWTPGPGEVSSGQITISVVNDTPNDGFFDLFEVRSGYTIDDIRKHLEAENERVHTGRPFEGYPPGWIHVATADAASGDSATLIAKVEPGAYGLVCIWGDRAAETSYHYHLIGPLEVE